MLVLLNSGRGSVAVGQGHQTWSRAGGWGLTLTLLLPWRVSLGRSPSLCPPWRCHLPSGHTLTHFVCVFALYALLAPSLAIFFRSSFRRLLRQLASQVFEDLNSAMCVLGLAQRKRVCTRLLPLPSCEPSKGRPGTSCSL